MTPLDPYNARRSLSVGGEYFALDGLDENGLDTSALPYSIRILLEGALRGNDGFFVRDHLRHRELRLFLVVGVVVLCRRRRRRPEVRRRRDPRPHGVEHRDAALLVHAVGYVVALLPHTRTHTSLWSLAPALE